jgi:hypothetical protein
MPLGNVIRIMNNERWNWRDVQQAKEMRKVHRILLVKSKGEEEEDKEEIDEEEKEKDKEE